MKNPAKFLRIIFNRPDLAASVRIIDGIDRWVYQIDTSSTLSISYVHDQEQPREDARICARVAQGLDLAEADDPNFDSFLGKQWTFNEETFEESLKYASRLDYMVTSSILAV